MNIFTSWILETFLITGGIKRMLKKIGDWFKNKKTVIASIVLVLQSVLDFIITGDITVLVDKITEALGLVSIRDGINKLPLLKSKFIAYLNGKKTYILMAINIINALVNYSVSQNIGQLVQDIAVAIGFMSIRAGINKINQ